MKPITFLFILITLFSSAQQSDEAFLNDIRLLDNHYGCDSMLLLLHKRNCYLPPSSIEELNKVLPKKIVAELLQRNSELYHSTEVWDISKITNAKGVSTKDSLWFALKFENKKSDSLFKAAFRLDTISNSEVLDEKIDSLFNKGIDLSKYSTIKHCYRHTTIYSQPLISKNGKWAIIEETSYVHSLNAVGAICIYKRRNNKWILKKRIGKWVS